MSVTAKHTKLTAKEKKLLAILAKHSNLGFIHIQGKDLQKAARSLGKLGFVNGKPMILASFVPPRSIAFETFYRISRKGRNYLSKLEESN